MEEEGEGERGERRKGGGERRGKGKGERGEGGYKRGDEEKWEGRTAGILAILRWCRFFRGWRALCLLRRLSVRSSSTRLSSSSNPVRVVVGVGGGGGERGEREGRREGRERKGERGRERKGERGEREEREEKGERKEGSFKRTACG